MRKILLILLTFSLVLCSVSSVFASYENIEIDPDGESIQYTYDNNLFIVNQTLYYIFGTYSDDGQYYDWSEDGGATWDDGPRISYTTDNWQYTFSSHFDGTYLYLFNWDGSSAEFHYHKGVPYDNGTILWEAGEQTQTYTSHFSFALDCYVDSSEFLYGVYWDEYSTDGVEIIKNGNTDGTWATASGYPKDVVPTGRAYAQVLIDTEDTVYISYSNATGLYVTLLEDNTLNGTVYTIDTGLEGSNTWINPIGYRGYPYCATFDINETLCYVYNIGNDLYFNTFNKNSGVGTPESFATAQSDSAPLISLDFKTYNLIIGWFESELIYVERDYTTGTFSSEVELTGNLANIKDNWEVENSRYNLDDFQVWVYSDTSGDPWAITFDLDPLRTPPAVSVDIIPWELSPFIIGMVGAFMCIFGPFWMVVQVKSSWDNLAYGFGFGFAITLIGIGLLAVWIL